MKTNYQNLSFFDAAATFMVLAGMVLIGFQFFVSAPPEVQHKITSSLSILDLHETWETQLAVNSFVFGGMNEFNRQASIALVEILPRFDFTPVQKTYTAVAGLLKSAGNFADAFTTQLASNYETNYAPAGVEASVGGKVMGAYYEKLGE